MIDIPEPISFGVTVVSILSNFIVLPSMIEPGRSGRSPTLNSVILAPVTFLGLGVFSFVFCWWFPIISLFAAPIGLGLSISSNMASFRVRAVGIWLNVFGLVVAADESGLNMAVRIFILDIRNANATG